MADGEHHENPEIKGGHLPAVKVGGMRISQNLPPVSHVEKEEEKEDKVASKNENVNISGYISQGNADFTTEAVKSFHEKPHPNKDPPRQINYFANNFAIQQPRK